MRYAIISSLTSAFNKSNHIIAYLNAFLNRWFARFPFGSLKVLSFIFVFAQTTVSCRKSTNCTSVEERNYIDSLIKSASQDEDALKKMYDNFAGQDNQLGCIAAMKEIGKKQRNESRFEEALKTHSEELYIAERLNDTIELIQAMNNIGTDFRRLGILESATSYHYRAWKLSEEFSDTSYFARKNYVVSLNGPGNIYMTTNNFDKAEEVLRKALDGESVLEANSTRR